MSGTPVSQFNRLITASHRRILFHRRIDIFRLSLTLASIVAVLASIAALFSGYTPWHIAVAVWALGFISALAWASTIHIPFSQTVSQTDYRLHLSDLLITAWSIQCSAANHDPWQQTILALADQRCHNLSPPSIPINGRAWNLIGLLAALTVLLALLPANHTSNSPQNLSQLTAIDLSRPSPQSSPHITIPPAPRPAASDPIDEHFDRPSQPNATASPDNPANQSTNELSQPDAATPGLQQSSQSGGLSRTQTPPPHLNLSPANSTPPQTATTAKPTSGSGPAAHITNAAASNSGTRTDAPAPSAPWQSASWLSSQQTAQSALQSGHIDPAYQDLVRDYFQNP